MGRHYECISSLGECNPFSYYLQLKKSLVANGQWGPLWWPLRVSCGSSTNQVKPSVLGLPGASVSISNLESRCPFFGGAASDVFRTKRDKGVGRLRKFTAFCIENGISLACSLSLSHPSSKSQTPKAKRNLRHLRSHAFPLETHTERRED